MIRTYFDKDGHWNVDVSTVVKREKIGITTIEQVQNSLLMELNRYVNGEMLMGRIYVNDTKVYAEWKDDRCSHCGREAITEQSDSGGDYVFSEYCPHCGYFMKNATRG